MKDPQLDVLAAELKSLKSRVGALEKLLERIFRQKPVSEKQLERALGVVPRARVLPICTVKSTSKIGQGPQ
jgi:hypothetical protein